MSSTELYEQMAMEIRAELGFDRRNEKHLQMLNVIMAQTGEKRWKACEKLLWELNPVGRNPETGEKTEDYRNISRHIIANNQLKRGLLVDHKGLGRTADSLGHNVGQSTRHALSMPALLLRFIELVDPTVNTGTPEERRKSVQSLMRAFPQYRIPKKI